MTKEKPPEQQPYEHQRFTVLKTHTIIRGMHPVTAIIRDNITRQVFEWNSRAHRKMRNAWHLKSEDGDVTTTKRKIRFWCWEPHLVSWWLVICNIIANIFWVINGRYAMFPTSRAERSARISYAGAILGGFFLMVCNYFSYVEAINNSHLDIRLPKLIKVHREDDDGEENNKNDDNTAAGFEKRIFVHPGKIYGRYKSPIGHNRHGVNEKLLKHLNHMGYPYILANDKIITSDEYDRVIKEREEATSATTRTKSSDEDLEKAQPPGKEEEEEDDENTTNNNNNNMSSATKSNSIINASDLIGQDVLICNNNYVCTTQIRDIQHNPLKLDERASYEWWTWYPAMAHLGVVMGVLGMIASWFYFIPMCAGYPWSKRDTVPEWVVLAFSDAQQLWTHLVYALNAHFAMAEAAGSWIKPRNCLGCWIALFNAIGSYGFALTGALHIPVAIGSDCCPHIARWGSTFCTFIGACGYTVAGYLMMVEFANPDSIDLKLGRTWFFTKRKEKE